MKFAAVVVCAHSGRNVKEFEQDSSMTPGELNQQPSQEGSSSEGIVKSILMVRTRFDEVVMEFEGEK